ncbi:MAG: hypothetical protein BWX50_01479 [Euryarchaeota archaeon ADurb.Bin009]|nr:MAG: hypothetical protein BWX50_01479 [Euryarchaeota archaeon ADurb.Bin009]
MIAFPAGVIAKTGIDLPACRSAVFAAASRICCEAQAVTRSAARTIRTASSRDMPVVWTATITASENRSRMTAASAAEAVVTAIRRWPSVAARATPAAWSMTAVAGSRTAPPFSSIRAITAGMGLVFTRPDIRPPIPWMRAGFVATSVPAPSEAITAASRSPLRTALLKSSEAPKMTKSGPARTSRCGVHIPKDRMRPSMFFRIASGVISSTGQANRRASGQSSICGVPTSTTRPFWMTTRHLPAASTICSSRSLIPPVGRGWGKMLSLPGQRVKLLIR